MIRIRYYLSLPPKTSCQDVERRTMELRQFCMDQPFDAVSNMVETFGVEALRNADAVTFPNQFFRRLTPKAKVGFEAALGDGDQSRPFSMFLFQYGRFRSVTVPWFMDGCCWTGIHLSDDLFLPRHLAVISALDKAKEMGFEVEVKDGGGYWKSRSKQRLLAVKRLMDQYPDPRILVPTIGNNSITSPQKWMNCVDMTQTEGNMGEGRG